VHPTAASGRLGPLITRLVLLVAVVSAAALLLGSLALPGALAASDVLDTVERDVLDMPPMGDATAPPQNSYVYAADGSELAELNFEENRVPVTLDEVPQDVIHAVLATEDADFFDHGGVDHTAIARAFVANLRGGGIEQGGSTITQQYVKNAFLDDAQTYQRKLQEAVYAIELERRMTKPEILENYLNRTYFGQGVYGIGTAAERYFSKTPEQLTLGEAATLAGIIRSPERNNPIASLDNAQTRRNVVLRQMAFHGFITDDQAQVATDEPLETEISEPTPPTNPFWVEWVSRLLTNDRVAEGLGSQTTALNAMGSTFEERRRMVFQSGLRIHTTLDPEMQEQAERTLRDQLSVEGSSPEQLAQEPMGALVSVEPGTGGIKAMAIGPQDYGSCSEDDSWIGEDAQGRLLCDRTKLNPVVPVAGSEIGKRQPGSAFKPFLTAAALEEGLPPTLEYDSTGPRTIESCAGGDDWEIRNVSGDGNLDMYEAMARSSNVYHGLLVDEVGPDKLAAMAQRLGIKPLADREIYCPLALGSAGVTPLEMASAYATLANSGVHCAPYAITRIEDAQGETIWEHSEDCTRVVDHEIADRVTDILEGPVTSAGTAPVANLGRWPTRGKTGSTNNFTDAWFVGYVRQLSTAAWVGYPGGTTHFASLEQAQEVCPRVRDDDGELVPVSEPRCTESRNLSNVTIAGQHHGRVYGGTIPAPMWGAYMRQVVQAFSPQPFPDPPALPTGQVPDLLQASSVSQAERLAEQAGFRLRTRTVEHWASAGTFVGQSPAAGDEAPIGSRLVLEVSDGEGDPPEVPDVVGLDLDDAIEALEDAGYAYAISDVEVTDEDDVDRVVGQSPAGGEPAGSDGPTVELQVGVPAPEDTEDDDPQDEDDEDDPEDDDEAPEEHRPGEGRGPDGQGPPGQD
jgi:penicillin-binding protein 1A